MICLSSAGPLTSFQIWFRLFLLRSIETPARQKESTSYQELRPRSGPNRCDDGVHHKGRNYPRHLVHSKPRHTMKCAWREPLAPVFFSTFQASQFPVALTIRLRIQLRTLPSLDRTDTERRVLPGISRECNLRSKIWWFTEFCNSHYVSHFAAFFIVAGTKISVAKSCS